MYVPSCFFFSHEKKSLNKIIISIIVFKIKTIFKITKKNKGNEHIVYKVLAPEVAKKVNGKFKTKLRKENKIVWQASIMFSLFENTAFAKHAIC